MHRQHSIMRGVTEHILAGQTEADEPGVVVAVEPGAARSGDLGPAGEERAVRQPIVLGGSKQDRLRG